MDLIPQKYQKLVKNIQLIHALEDSELKYKLSEREFEFLMAFKHHVIRLPKSASRNTPASLNIRLEAYYKISGREKEEFESDLQKRGIIVSTYGYNYVSFLILNDDSYFYLYGVLTDKKLI